MRLLLVSDLHYSLPLFDWVLEVAGDFDVVVMAGDHLDLASLVDGRAQATVVKKYFERIRAKTQLLICSGNHDLDGKNESGEKIARWLSSHRNAGVLSDGESKMIGDTLFTACPWWDGPVSQGDIGRQLAAAAKLRQGDGNGDGRGEDRGKPPTRWIWIYHAPPSKSPIAWGGARYFGDDALTSWIAEYRPDIVMCGHVHEAPYVAQGSWVDYIGTTWVFNTGHYLGSPPAHIIMDTEAGEAVWLSAAGYQRVRFDDGLTRPLSNLKSLPDWLTDGGPSLALGQS